jgi:hypothetical protein
MANLEVADETAVRVLGHSLGGLMATYNVSRHRKQKMAALLALEAEASADRWRGACRRECGASSAGFIAPRMKVDRLSPIWQPAQTDVCHVWRNGPSSEMGELNGMDISTLELLALMASGVAIIVGFTFAMTSKSGLLKAGGYAFTAALIAAVAC